VLSPATPPPPIRVLIVDADRRVRESLRDLICCEVGLDAVAAVGSADDARDVVAGSVPEVVVIDPLLPGLDVGLELIDELHAAHPATRLLVMGWTSDMDVAGHAADAVLDKSGSPEDLVAAITRSVRRGAAT
jgi:DNA-binding NarL/FixJ family response regulator